MSIWYAKRYEDATPVAVEVAHGQIKSVQALTRGQMTEQKLRRETMPWIAPGLFDIQINGGLGFEFSSDCLTCEQVKQVCDWVLRQGVFRFCPTVTTNSPETLCHAVATLAATLDQYPQYAELITGIHLEGPFISRQDGSRGAHPLEWCSEYNPDLFRKLQQAARGLIRIVTFSPEYDGMPEFVELIEEYGAVPALGHTHAKPNDIILAADCGAQLSTHLSNATNHELSKWENYFLAQLLEARLRASLIADGFHVSPMMLDLILKVKGPDRIILISDQASVSGLAPGKYHTGLCDLELCPSGKVELSGSDHLLAGASLPISVGVANLMTIGNLSLKEVWPLATRHAAELLDLPAWSNGDGDFLDVGKAADFLLFQVEEAKLGEFGVADTAHFQSGRLLMQSVVYKGVDLLKESRTDQ
ncbi:MAG: amidohydrolase family protein [Planctomycetia bacterium]|nr:amidohydrolase family protein [Planctomycetia bacterium]